MPPATETPAPTESLTTAPIAGPTATPRHHTVASGESLNYIAGQYDMSPEAVAAANGLSLDSVLSIGQVLTIPGPTAAAPGNPEASTATPTDVPSIAEEIHVVASGIPCGRSRPGTT